MLRLLLLLGYSLLVSCLPVTPAIPVLHLQDRVIAGEEVWQGEVRIRGVVTVKKGGRLILRPGTRVIFEPLDRDGDGIGDGEILVEGSLQAIGTAEAPIVLTSGAEQPQPQDWKYLYLDFAQQVQIRHLLAEYAYSGIQIHFCKAQVTDSEFRYNVDGVRFSTVNLELAGNLIHHNRHGIRYEERRGQGRIHHNRIAHNEIGIFAVTRAEDRTRFELNNIHDNQRYQVKLGLDQRHDLSYPRNWWGGLQGETLAESFFDGNYDRSLGRVSAPEALDGSVDISDWE